MRLKAAAHYNIKKLRIETHFKVRQAKLKPSSVLVRFNFFYKSVNTYHHMFASSFLNVWKLDSENELK